MITNNGINPMQIIEMIRSGRNPQQILMSILEQGVNNPVMANLLDLARQNRTADIEKIARNLCAERGIDYDKEFNSFKAGLFESTKFKK